jgi:hypothetical protein
MARGFLAVKSMAESVCAEIIYYRERAGLAREKADAATVPETKKNYLAAEARWLALVRSHQSVGHLRKQLELAGGAGRLL